MGVNRPKIIRVWGHADLFDLEFTNEGGSLWSCNVPPDLADGVYAVEITAMNEFKQTAYWTGFLYMCNGACHFEFNIPTHIVWSSASYKIEFERSCPHRV